MKRTTETKPIFLDVKQFKVKGNVPYSHFIQGQEGYCWFCGEKTDMYRSFKFTKYESKIAGLNKIKEIKSETSLNLWSCPSCKKKLDKMDKFYEKLQQRLLLAFGVIGFIVVFILLRRMDGMEGETGLAVFGGIIGGIFIGFLSVPIAKLLRHIEFKGEYGKIRKRLQENPEVLALYQQGFTYFYY